MTTIPDADEAAEREARDAAVAAFVPRVLPMRLACAFDQLLPVIPWSRWVPAEILRRPDIAAKVNDYAPTRWRLRETLTAHIGAEHADTVMRYLCPAPWSVLQSAGVRPPPTIFGDDGC